ncbi:MAG TPA: efflux RND transporter periplasmic adaptor subunit [Candidatus Binataceae bacterium]|nr:efflux RND transporter periplasmic adaptor subunit [Candidatus Binataceae bacterium]
MRQEFASISSGVSIFAFAMLAMLGVAACHGNDAAQPFGGHGAVPVMVAKAVRKTVAQRLHAIGRVESYSTVEVKSQVNGQVMQVNFKEGQEVHKGDLLFTIDPRPFEAALNQAIADMNRDKAQSLQLANDFHRYETLLKEGVGSQQQYDEAKSKYEAIAATVAADEANVQTARLNLEYTRILSPIDGRTGSIILHAGNVVKANADTGMVTINQIKPVYVNFALPEQNLAAVRMSMTSHPLTVDVIAPGDKTDVQGRLSFVDNTVDATTGTIALKGIFDNQDQKLWPGQFVDTYLTLSELPDAVLVPSQAVQTGQEGSYVFVIDPKMKAAIRKVAVGETIEGDTIIENGLGGGETIVTDGQLRLMPGATVMIKNADHANARAAS